MLLIDRYILVRFMTNFLVLFGLLFVFAAAIDVLVQLDKFVEAGRDIAGPDAGFLAVTLRVAGLVLDFEAPRVFQFYAYLHGMAAIGAMGFTLAQMHRYRELVAVMASGVSLYRVAMPFLIGVFGLSALQLFNQELVLPRIAPLLLRDHGEIGQRGVENFKVQFTPDSKGNLLQAPLYDPRTETLSWPTILQRDEQGRTTQRISAREAKWSESEKAWKLTEGQAIRPQPADEAAPQDVIHSEPVDSFATDLTPHVLLMRHYSQFASMLSLNQIGQMLQTQMDTKRDTLLRYRYSRFSTVLVNVLILALTLPCFLLREPANLVRQSVLCASLAIPATVGSALGMMVALPGISPAVSVFLPAIVLMFMSLFPWTYFKT